jgi:haloacetate dehalogenase
MQESYEIGDTINADFDSRLSDIEGARVATRFAKDHPQAVDRLVVMDNVPTRIVGRELDAAKAKAKGYWFFFFT